MYTRLRDNPGLRLKLAKRTEVMRAIREFFDALGFQEVETPTLVKYPGMEPNLDVFATELKNERGETFAAHLITSPEYAMKKLLAAGYERIYNITRSYRNGEPFGGTHNSEFTMIEWYRSPSAYEEIMEDTEKLVAYCAVAVTGSELVTYQGQQLDLSLPWPRMTVAAAMEKWAGIDLDRAIDDPGWFRAEAVAKGCEITDDDSWDDVFFKIFLRDVEPRLGQPEPGSSAPARPVILCEYPKSMAALARLKPEDPRYALRFEAYALGLELGNAFAELNDAVEQRARLIEEAAERRKLGRNPAEIDEEFLKAVGEMPPAAGIAFGVDRLVMLLTDAPDISEVLFFPIGEMFSE